MIWFSAVAGILTLATLAILLRPLIRRPRPGAEEAEPVAALFRRQLATVDEELAEGRLTSEQAETTRAEVTRRLLTAADRDDSGPGASLDRASEISWRIGAAVAIAGLLPAAAIAVYFAVGTPSAIDRGAGIAAAAPHGAAELTAAADQIKAHLQKAPDDLKGWTLLGRTLASLGRFPRALDAYNHAIALAPDNTGLHAEFGEVLVLRAQGAVTPTAAAEFAKAPDDPRSRYYAAEAALQRGDPAAAKQKLQALLAAAPADAPWRQAVADRLAELASKAGAGAGTSAPAGGPTAQDVAAAQSMTPEQRQALIRGMVDRLAQRLEQHPDDKTGWERLAHAYDVLGEPDKAQAARARAEATGNVATAAAPPAPAASSAQAAPSDAQGWIDRARAFEGQGRTADALAALRLGNTAFPGSLALLEAYMDALAGSLREDKPTPELVAVATQVNALDAKRPDALWYLGLAAAQNGDHFRAAAYWTRLLSELPPGDAQRALVQHRLDTLR